MYTFIRGAKVLLLCLLVLAFLAAKKDGRFLALVLALIPGLLFLCWLEKRLRHQVGLRKPISSVEAVLVNHRQEYCGSRIPAYRKSFLTFRLESGKELEFEVSREEYDRIQLGAKGELRYRAWGWEYVSFRRASNGE